MAVTAANCALVVAQIINGYIHAVDNDDFSEFELAFEHIDEDSDVVMVIMGLASIVHNTTVALADHWNVTIEEAGRRLAALHNARPSE